MAQKNETELQREILQRLSKLPGVMIWRNNSGVGRGLNNPGHVIRYGCPGAPDILGVADGQAVGIEVKGPRGRLSKRQKNFRQAFEKAGGRYVVARSVEDALEGVGHGQP
jgi:hypothetical protein